MTPAGMASLRIAATLTHVLPALRLRLGYRGQTVLEVAHGAEDTATTMGACAFRKAVAGAHELTKQGSCLALKALPPGTDPTVDIAVCTGDAALPGGIYGVAIGDRRVHGFATTLPLARCRDVVHAELGDVGRVRLHHDTATEVTFVYTVDPVIDVPATEHLEHLLGALFADEVVHEFVT